ncbi:uncharacterized protein [Salminus brasiliensis]|uniref:uncharacterized protein isoform X2 n=1 Tax=Salminus brasiliensis TaxID=930266 RepID=UPI003B831713
MKLCAATETKPAVLVVLHHTSDPEATVPDSSRSVDRGNTLTVDCLFQEDRGLLQCSRNQRALKKVTQWIKPQAGTPGHKSPGERPDSTGPVPQREAGESEPAAAENAESEAGGTTNIKSEADRGAGTGAEATGTAGDLKFLSCVSGKTLGSDEGFIRKLIDGIPDLKEVSTVEECDVILAFCPVASRAGTDIESALKKLQQLSETKPAVLVVLHHTSDPEAMVPDSSRSVDRGNTLTVDCLFQEDRGLLQCSRNQRALKKVTQWIKPQAGTPGHKSPGERPDSTGPVPQREGGESEPAAAENAESEAGRTTNIKSEADRGAGTGAEATGTADLKFLSCVSGKTLGSDEGFIRKLIDGKPDLKEVSTVEECDVILAFCPVASRAGTDIESALKKLQQLSETKPAVLLVLHHTSDPEATVPDSSRSVDRGNTLTVDCLFHEDRGLLQCSRNQRALEKVTQWIKPQMKPDVPGPTADETQKAELEKLKREITKKDNELKNIKENLLKVAKQRLENYDETVSLEQGENMSEVLEEALNNKNSCSLIFELKLVRIDTIQRRVEANQTESSTAPTLEENTQHTKEEMEAKFIYATVPELQLKIQIPKVTIQNIQKKSERQPQSQNYRVNQENTTSGTGEQTEGESTENTDLSTGEQSEGESTENTGLSTGEQSEGESTENTGLSTGEQADGKSILKTGLSTGEQAEGESTENTGLSTGEQTEGESTENTGLGAGEQAEGESTENTGLSTGEQADGKSTENTGLSTGERAEGKSTENTGLSTGERAEGESTEKTGGGRLV